MPSFLNENQVGYDAMSVGFPELGHCMGIAIELPAGLYGFHHSSKSDTSRVQAIINFMATKGDAITAATAIYGSCRFDERYGSQNAKAQWKSEMQQFATALGFNGNVFGFNLSSSSHIPRGKNRDGTAYMEFVKQAAGPCTVRFKRMAKMGSTNAAVRTATAVYGSGRTGASAFPTTINVQMDTTLTKSQSGVMHAARNLLQFVH